MRSIGGIASHEVSCRRFLCVLGHDGDRHAEYGRLVGGGSLFEDGPRVTSASTRSTASPSSCLVPSLPCLPHRAEGSVCNEFPSLQSAALVGFTRSAGRNDGWLSHSCSFRARASLSMADNGCCFKLPKWNVFSLKSERGLLAPPSGFIPRKVLASKLGGGLNQRSP